MVDNVEKRRFKRFEFREEVQVFPVHPSASSAIYEVQKGSIATRTLDISEGGLGMEWEEDLNPEILLKLNFRFSKDIPVEIYGKIIWSRDKHCGVKFMIPDATIQHGVKALSNKRTS